MTTRVRESAQAAEYAALEQKFQAADRRAARSRTAAGRCRAKRRSGGHRREQDRVHRCRAEVKGVRAEAVALVKDVSGDSTYNDVNYVFPTYIVTQLPVGLVGLLMAAIFAAAMSTIAGELSALSTSTRDRLLPPLGPRRRRRGASVVGVEGRDVVLGGVCVDRRDLGRRARLADRSRQSIRIVLLRIDPRRVPAGDRLEPRATRPARSLA